MTGMQTTKQSPTLQIRRSEERGLQDLGWSKNQMTFSFADYHDPDWMHFGPLRVLIESRIDPHSGFSSHPHRDAEIASYVVSGTLTHSDSFGNEAEVTAGEMQLISAGSRGMIHAEDNRQDELEHHYQIWLIPERPDTQFAYHQLKYAPEDRQGRFRLYVSPDGQGGSMPANTDAYIYAGLFAPDDAAKYELESGRGVWIQVVKGRLRADGVTLEAGDGLGVTGKDRLDLTFEDDSEVLLIDVRMNAPLIWT